LLRGNDSESGIETSWAQAHDEQMQSKTPHTAPRERSMRMIRCLPFKEPVPIGKETTAVFSGERQGSSRRLFGRSTTVKPTGPGHRFPPNAAQSHMPALGNSQEIIYRARRGAPTPPRPPTESLTSSVPSTSRSARMTYIRTRRKGYHDAKYHGIHRIDLEVAMATR
jgi:hypothetical protein